MRVSCSNAAGSALGGEGGSGRCGLSQPPCRIRRALDSLAPWVGLLFLRLLIGWEFLESGLEKLGGENWFADIQEQFLFPFNHLPAELNWQLAMWFEIVGGLADTGAGHALLCPGATGGHDRGHGCRALAGRMAFAGRAGAGLCHHR